MGRLLFLLLALACAGGGVAQVTVYSQRPDATAITIYRDGLALVTETRSVELPAGPVTVVFRGVVDSLLSQSAVMTGADRPLAETNFSFDRLTPQSLVEHSVGKRVTLVRTNRRTGKVSRLEATIVSTEDGVVLQSVDGSEALRCSGIPERLEFSEIPGELNSTPTLSVQLAPGTAGMRTMTVSYLARGFSWSADYVARLNNAATRMELTGWITLENLSHSSFSQAQVQLVAGRLNLLPADEGGSQTDLDEYRDKKSEGEDDGEEEGVALFPQCFPAGEAAQDAVTPVPYGPGYRVNMTLSRTGEMLEEVMVTGARIQREELGDYQLYRLPWPTDLNARQTKQAVFLTKPGVKIERFYSVRLRGFLDDEVYPEGVPNLMLRWENRKAAGLGEPLPAGTVRVFEGYAGSEIFAGEAQIQDKPIGLPVELVIARAMNLSSDLTVDEEDDSRGVPLRRSVTVHVEHHFINRKEVPVSVEVRHPGNEGWSTPVVVRTNLPAGRKFGDFAWHFTVPAGGEQWLRYELRSVEPAEE